MPFEYRYDKVKPKSVSVEVGTQLIVVPVSSNEQAELIIGALKLAYNEGRKDEMKQVDFEMSRTLLNLRKKAFDE